MYLRFQELTSLDKFLAPNDYKIMICISKVAQHWFIHYELGAFQIQTNLFLTMLLYFGIFPQTRQPHTNLMLFISGRCLEYSSRNIENKSDETEVTIKC